MKRAVCALPGNDVFAARVAAALGAERIPLQWRRFPDGESYVRFPVSPANLDLALVWTMRDPDPLFLALHFAVRAARELGASRVGLIAPYLAYMRQDRRFRDGEAVSSRDFAALLSADFDWLVTVDPHLHRYAALSEIYTIPAVAVSAAPALAGWIRAEVARPLVIIGPDAESRQWVAEVAQRAEAPHAVLRKMRRGDREVEVNATGLEQWKEMTPVIVDDIVASARTMAAVVERLRTLGYPPPVCVAVHGVWAEDALGVLRAAGATRIVTTNTIPHATSAIDLSGPVAAAAASLMTENPAR